MSLQLEYQGTTSGFILGRSRIGLDRLDATATVTWLPALCDALDVSVSRGGQRDGLVDSLDAGTMVATFLDAMDPTSDDNVRPNTPIRLSKNGLPIFTGTVADIAITDDRDGRRYVTLTASDARTSLANTQRYGAISDGGAGYESWAARINRLRTSAQTSTSAPDADPSLTVYDTTTSRTAPALFGSIPSGVSNVRAYRSPGEPGKPTAFLYWAEDAGLTSWGALARGIDVPVSGLTVGATYRVSGAVFDRMLAYSPERPVSWKLGVAGKGWADAVEWPAAGATVDLGSLSFVATATTHSLRFANAQPVARTSGSGPFVNLGVRLRVQQVTTDPYVLRDVVYESTLANHLDLACNSVGARWWVDRDNIVQFRRAGDRPDVIASLSDVHDPGGPLHVCYQDVTLGYDTRNAINNLSLTNHGRRFDTETASWAADDQTSVHEDMTAIASWGARSTSVDTSLYTGTGHEADVTIRALELLDGAVTPSVRPTSARFNVADGEHVLEWLDYYSRVQVTRAGTTWTCRVVGIEHEITPLDGHHITLTLREDY